MQLQNLTLIFSKIYTGELDECKLCFTAYRKYFNIFRVHYHTLLPPSTNHMKGPFWIKLLVITSNNCGDMDKVQNKVLRIITSAVYSAPINALEIHTGLEPLKFSRERETFLSTSENVKYFLCRKQLVSDRKKLTTHQSSSLRLKT